MLLDADAVGEPEADPDGDSLASPELVGDGVAAELDGVGEELRDVLGDGVTPAPRSSSDPDRPLSRQHAQHRQGRNGDDQPGAAVPHPGGQVRARPPSTCACTCPTVCPPSWPVLSTIR